MSSSASLSSVPILSLSPPGPREKLHGLLQDKAKIKDQAQRRSAGLSGKAVLPKV